MKNSRVKAFTLTEMIVVMLLTAVVIGMAYAVFEIVSKSYRSFAVKNEQVNDAERLEHWLRRDMDRADAIYATADELYALAGGDTVKYQFADTAVVRYSIRADSFRVVLRRYRSSFEGELLDGPLRHPVDKVCFDLLLEGQDIPEMFYKSYSAAQLINLTYARDRSEKP